MVGGKFTNTDSDITNMWAGHFETLGQPTIDNSYNESFRIKVESAVEQIFAACVSTLSGTELFFAYDTVKEVCQGLKCGVAGGPDMTTYEHLKYGIFSPNYTCLYLSHAMFPHSSEHFLFFLYSRGKVLRHTTGTAIVVFPCFQFSAKFLR